VVIGEWGGWYKTKEDQAWQKALAEFLVKEGFTDQFCAYVRFICIWVCLDPRMPACALIRLSIDMIVYTQFSDRLVPQPRRKCAVINAYTCCCKPNCSITSAPVYSHPTPHHYYIYTYTHIHMYKKIQSGDTGGLLEEDWETPVKVPIVFCLCLAFGFAFAWRCAARIRVWFRSARSSIRHTHTAQEKLELLKKVQPNPSRFEIKNGQLFIL
jgi:hypothetical protein